jgi:hypothetical protein
MKIFDGVKFQKRKPRQSSVFMTTFGLSYDEASLKMKADSASVIPMRHAKRLKKEAEIDDEDKKPWSSGKAQQHQHQQSSKPKYEVEKRERE